MPMVRIARNCINAEAMTPTQCPCCGAIKLLLVDGQDRVRAIAELTLDALKGIVAEAEAGKLEPFDPVSAGTLSARQH